MNLSGDSSNELQTSKFSLEAYAHLLTCALRKGYLFLSYDAVLAQRRGDSSFSAIAMRERTAGGGRCLLRHDVDGDMRAAVAMARTESALGVRANYFLMLQSPCYNLLSRSGLEAATQLLDLGHTIGLHFDQGGQIVSEGLDQAVRQQITVLEDFLCTSVTAVSFHQPSRELLANPPRFDDYINTYLRSDLYGFLYLSDSNRKLDWQSVGAGKYSHAEEALGSLFPRNIQLLIHPMWWVYEDSSTEDVWNRVLESNLAQVQEQLLSTERAYGGLRTLKVNLAGQ